MLSLSPLIWHSLTANVDLEFDYDKDESRLTFSSRKERLASKYLAYEFFRERMVDGLLVSRTMLQTGSKIIKDPDTGKYFLRDSSGNEYANIRSRIRARGRGFVILADPGTWHYVNKFELPDYLYDTEGMVDYYNDMGFDIAGSVDWPIVDKIRITENGKRNFITLTDKEKERRRLVTLENAGSFIKECRSRNISFIPFGTIQGYSPDTYRDSMKELLGMGYDYIAIGGLPSYSEKEVVSLLPMLWKEIEKSGTRPGLHMYGRFPSPAAVKIFLQNGVTSFDNNYSFIASRINPCTYWDPDYMWNQEESPSFVCCGAKIPHSLSPAVHRARRELPEKDFEKLMRVLDTTFRLFCEYSKGNVNASRKFFRTYDRMNRMLDSTRIRKRSSEKKIAELTLFCKQALEREGWIQCGCTSCSMLKAHIVLVRNTNRNSHRFFHNTYVQYQRYQSELVKARKELKGKYPLYDWSTVRSVVKKNDKVTRRRMKK